jgi:hypothetical protein
MGADTGTFIRVTQTFREVETTGKLFWFLGLVIITLLVTEGVELNSGPPTGQEKIEQILTHVRNQEKDFKVIKIFLEFHNLEIKVK